MERFELQKLRDLPIEEVAHRLGMTVQKHKALCPFHEDRHPSLSFHTRSNTYKCFVCDARGGVIDLVMHHLHKDFKEACQWLGADCRPEPVSAPGSLHPPSYTPNRKSSFEATRYERYFQCPYLNPEARTFLFTERKLHPAVVRWCRLHSYTDRTGTPWLQIPYYDADGRLTGVQNRRLNGVGSNPKPRFLFPKGSRCGIYNLPVLKLLREGEDLWIAEGCSDCWALLSSGKKAIAIPSATLLKASDLDILTSHFKEGAGGGSLHMYPDADIPGEKLYLRLKAHFPRLVRHSLPPGCKDFGQHWATTNQLLTINYQLSIINSQLSTKKK